MTGTAYLDPGSRASGRYDPPRRCIVLTRWGKGGGPRNVAVEYEDGSRAVIPFPRRLRRDRDAGRGGGLELCTRSAGCPHYPRSCDCPHPWWRHYHWVPDA